MEYELRLDLELTPTDETPTVDDDSCAVRAKADAIVAGFVEGHRKLWPGGCGDEECYACGDFCQEARNAWFLKQITRRNERKFE
jgi:hypothetical protein